MNFLKFIYSKKDDGLNRVRTIFGIKITTKPKKLKQEEQERMFMEMLTAIHQNCINICFHTDRTKQIMSDNYIMNLLESEKYRDKKRLERFGYKVFSQNYEDGIINEIFNRIGTTNKVFVEFGVQDGLECNTHYLLLQGWKGTFIEGSEHYFNMIKKNFHLALQDGRLEILNRFIDADNINSILKETMAFNYKEIDLLSIDIDGNDYHVLKAINTVNPRVIVIEFNAKFPPPMEWIMPYNPNYIWDNTDDSSGASLQSITNLASSKGYRLVGTNITGVNAFYVRKDLCLNRFPEDCSALNLYNPAKPLSFWSGHPSKYFLGNYALEEKFKMTGQDRTGQDRTGQDTCNI